MDYGWMIVWMDGRLDGWIMDDGMDGWTVVAVG